jgi:hypothetical protein
MNPRLREACRETHRYVTLALRALIFWSRPAAVKTVDGVVEFVESRSKFVAQTTLYGYVRTRAGTRYASLVEDDVFANSVNIAKWEIYLACLCDLSIYATAGLAPAPGAVDHELRDLAIHVVEIALGNEPIPDERPHGFEDVRQVFATRAGSTAWREAAVGEAAFANSLDALVYWAPVADELKIHDVEIVRYSMRFRWKKVRDQFDDVLDADAVLADWRATRPQAPDR